ncbi:MAG: methyltransferase domain-containing protein [Candidatus Alcyoniella australis]|nr:methyltransferase domain-containing protein [Candidatus Alcyoniella australis]
MDQAQQSERSPEFDRYRDDDRDRRDELTMVKHRHRARYLIDGARRIRNGLRGLDLLDAGCGQGLLLSLIPDRAALCGFDASQALIENNLAKDCAELSLRDVYATGFDDERFDVVFCQQVLEHLQHPQQALAELARVARPGGLIAASVPYDERIKLEVCVHCGKTTPRNGHLQRFDECNINEFLPPQLKLVALRKVCCRPVYNRGHRLPVPLFRLLDRAALTLGLGPARWMVFFARKVG